MRFGLALFIGMRYTRSKRSNHFISFISLISTLGIALGVMVLITVLSVMNGFDHEIKSRILNMVPPVTVQGLDGPLQAQKQLDETILKTPGVTAMAPFVQTQGMIQYQGQNGYILLQGIDPALQSKVSPIASKMVRGSLTDLKPGEFGILIGADKAQQMGIVVGDKITVMVPKISITPIGSVPRLKQFVVKGIFKTGYTYDNTYALIDLKDAQTLLQLQNTFNGYELKVEDLYRAPYIANLLNQRLPFSYQSFDWTQQNPNFFKALQMEKTMMFLILILIIAVAAFNLLSSLVMMVTDKRGEIAILRTLGAKTGTIMRVFVVQGMMTGCIGILFGVGLGIALSLHVTEIVAWLQHLLGVQFLSANVYYIDFVPSLLIPTDIVKIIAVALGLCVVATLYPAWQASRVLPAEALRYE